MRELRDVIMIVRRYAVLLVVAALLGAALGFLIVRSSQTKPSASVVLSLRWEGIAEFSNPSLRYDGYYVVETERRLGILLGDALRSTPFRDELFKVTGVMAGRVERLTDMDYRLTLRGEHLFEKETRGVLERIAGDRMRDIASRTGEPLEVSVAVGTVVPGNVFSPILAAVSGALVLVTLVAFACFLREYLRGVPSNDHRH
jgi:hypothetical protein